MNDEDIYRKVLDDAEAEIARLRQEVRRHEAVAEFARAKLGLAAPEPPEGEESGARPVGGGVIGGTITSDAFFNMTAADAIRKFLAMMKRTQSVQKIVDALKEGGFPHQAENLYNTVYAALNRNKGEIFSKVKREWGLKEWYNR